MTIAFTTFSEFEKLAVRAERQGYRWNKAAKFRMVQNAIKEALRADKVAFLYLESWDDDRHVFWKSVGEMEGDQDYISFSDFIVDSH